MTSIRTYTAAGSYEANQHPHGNWILGKIMLHAEKKKTVAGPTHVEGAAVPHAAGSIAAKLANARLRDWICGFRATCSNYRRASFYSFSKKKQRASFYRMSMNSVL